VWRPGPGGRLHGGDLKAGAQRDCRRPGAWGAARTLLAEARSGMRRGAEAPERRQRLLDAAAERTPSANALDWSGPAREGAIHGRMELVSARRELNLTRDSGGMPSQDRRCD
jgi:hypothetical protein